MPRGIFGRWRVPKTARRYLESPARSPQVGRAVNGYADVAPMPPDWGSLRPQGFVPEERNAASFIDPADYINTTMGLLTGDRPQNTGGITARNIIPDAPAVSDAELDNRAWREARSRARAAIDEEGVPYWQSPSVERDQSAMLSMLDRERRDRAEWERRQNVSWEDWWRYGGRQDERRYNPADPAYRFTRAPRRTRR